MNLFQEFWSSILLAWQIALKNEYDYKNFMSYSGFDYSQNNQKYW